MLLLWNSARRRDFFLFSLCACRRKSAGKYLRRDGTLCWPEMASSASSREFVATAPSLEVCLVLFPPQGRAVGLDSLTPDFACKTTSLRICCTRNPTFWTSFEACLDTVQRRGSLLRRPSFTPSSRQEKSVCLPGFFFRGEHLSPVIPIACGVLVPLNTCLPPLPQTVASSIFRGNWGGGGPGSGSRPTSAAVIIPS